MTLKECADLYEKNPEKYKGFGRKGVGIYVKPLGKTQTCQFKVYNKQDEFVYVSPLVGVAEALGTDWEMLEVEPKVPEGFVKGYDGKYRKPCEVEFWVNVYWLKDKGEIMTITYNTEKAALRNSYHNTFVKTLRLVQQYSIKLEDIQ